MISWGSVLNAQTTPATPPAQQQPQTQPPMPDTPPTQQTPPATPRPDNPPSTQQPSQAPDQAQAPAPKAGTASATGSQEFMGTVVKSGDKYVLKDDSGKTYDIDHQDDVKKFEGKRVRVQGTLDASGTRIQVK